MTRLIFLGAVMSMVTACSQPEIERERLKEELKQEILAELAAERRQGVPAGPLLEHQPYQGAQPVALPTGNVTGRVLLGKRGLPGCRVRSSRLEQSGFCFSFPDAESALRAELGLREV